MGDIVIATSAGASAVRQWLSQEMPIVSHEGLTVQLEEWSCGKETYFSCCCTTPGRFSDEVFVYFVASALAGAIHTYIEPEWIQQHIRRFSTHITTPWIQSLTQRTLEALEKASTDQDSMPRTRVLLDIMDYLDIHRQVHLEGFARFRLKDYRKQVAQVVDYVVSEWDAQQEQLELIELLRFFVDTQDPCVDAMDVVIERDGLFRLLDENHCALDQVYLECLVSDLAQGTVNYGNLLISALVALAPRQLKCHCKEPLPVLETLMSVFGDRMSTCLGCSICNTQAKPCKHSRRVPKGY